MIKYGNKDIARIFYGEHEVRAILKGDTIVKGAFELKGKFKEDSTENNWWITKDGSSVVYYTNIADYVNPDTKEFDYKTIKKVKTLQNLFYQNSAIQEITEVKGTDTPVLKYMFYQCAYLESADLSGLKDLQITDMLGVFDGCNRLTKVNLKGLDTSRCINFASTFKSCGNLTEVDLSDINTESSAGFSAMFQGCNVLKSLNLSKFKTDKAGAFNNMFRMCAALTSLDLSSFNTENGTIFQELFYGCSNLQELIVNFDFSKASAFTNWMYNCSKLKTIRGSISNLKISVSMSMVPMDNESAMLFINGVTDVEDEQTLTFKSSTYSTLTDEQIAIATAKGWSVVSA